MPIRHKIQKMRVNPLHTAKMIDYIVLRSTWKKLENKPINRTIHDEQLGAVKT